MSYNKENEKLYLPTDDTVDVGKEPLPLDDEKIREQMKKSIAFIKREFLST